MDQIYQGSCMCNGIQFEYYGTLSDFSLCHCKMCQKFGGGAFGSFVSLKKSVFKYIKGEKLVKVFNSSDWASRAFCSECGSSLMYIYHELPDTLSVSAGLFDSDLNSGPIKHIFVKDKCSWYNITDALPQIERY